MATHAQMREVRRKRAAKFASLYATGMTLEEIGQQHGITRERVRQLLAEIGVTRDQGGARVVAAANEARRVARLKARGDARCLRTFGCNRETAIALNGNSSQFHRGGSLARAFIQQRETAKLRGIDWYLNFPEWIAIWRDSGRLAERGQGRNKFCMARNGDTGPYEVGNVYITTCAGNVSDYQAELKRRGVMCEDGWVRLPERAGSRSESPLHVPRGISFNKRNPRNPYQAYCDGKYIGCYPTEDAARAAHLAAKQQVHGS